MKIEVEGNTITVNLTEDEVKQLDSKAFKTKMLLKMLSKLESN